MSDPIPSPAGTALAEAPAAGAERTAPADPWARELYFADDTREIVPLSPDATAVLLYTSGTTGKPKGAELTHFQLFMNCTVAGDLFAFRDDDIGVAVLPRHCALSEIANGQLVAIKVPGLSTRRQVRLVYRRGEQSHAAEAFLEIVRATTGASESNAPQP